MTSMAGAGDDDGSGGVVMASSIDHEQWFCARVDQNLPRPWPGPNRLEENNDRRGVASWGLFCLSVLFSLYPQTDTLPLINVEILRQVGGQASSWRRATDGFQVEVVRLGSLHGQVFEVEIAGPKPGH